MLPDAPSLVDTVHHDRSYICFVCGDIYDVETDAFHDGGMTYYVNFLAEQVKCHDV